MGREMIDYARTHRLTEHSNLRFEVADARRLSFREEFDLVVSFNALHWIPQPEQKQALQSIKSALKLSAIAQYGWYQKGERRSLESVLEETRLPQRWLSYFRAFHDPYLHLTPEEYAALGESVGLQVRGVYVSDKSWDFRSRSGFFAFGSVSFVGWTRMLPDPPSGISPTTCRWQRSPLSSSTSGSNEA